MYFFGFLDSSPRLAAPSKPPNESMAATIPAPIPVVGYPFVILNGAVLKPVVLLTLVITTAATIITSTTENISIKSMIRVLIFTS